MQAFRTKKIAILLFAAFAGAIVLPRVSAGSQSAESPTPAAGAVHFSVEPSGCQVHYSVSSTLHTVHGEFAVKRGAIQVNPDTGKASGEIVVDATSGHSGSHGRDKRMHKEILESARFPEISFRPDRVIGKVSPSGASSVEVHGTFTLHGASHELTVPVQVSVSGSRWTGTASFAVPYIAWGLKDPSQFILRVSPTVNVNLDLSGSVLAAESR